MTTFAVPLLLRLVALCGGWLLYLYVVVPAAFADSEDANIGAGLIAFGLVICAAALWSFVDGMRMPFARLALIWSVVGVALGIVAAVPIAAEDGFDFASLLTELAGTGPFIAILAIVPALLAGLVGSAVRSGADPAH